MYRPKTPDSSPLGSRGSKTSYFRTLYSPEHSSPLGPLPKNLNTHIHTQNLREHRKRQYKSQSSSRTFPQLTSKRLGDSPASQLLHDRFKAHCLERVRCEKRRKVVNKARSSDHPFSSDGFDIENDCEMDEDAAGDEDALFLDELYRRVMLNEIRKSKHAMNVSFELDFGSSIDPNMYEDIGALEEGFIGKKPNSTEEEFPLSDAEYDDALIAEYLAELEESELQAMPERVTCGMVDIGTEDPSDLEKQFASQVNMEQVSPTRSVYSELAMSSTPASPIFHASDIEDNDVFSCPFCYFPRLCDQIACHDCMTTRSLQYAQTVWTDPNMHSTPLNRSHTPLVTETPTGSGVGTMMFCSSEGCDWCFAL